MGEKVKNVKSKSKVEKDLNVFDIKIEPENLNLAIDLQSISQNVENNCM